MIHHLLLIIFSLLFGIIRCQNSLNIDSLYRIIKTQKDDSNKVKNYIYYCNKIVYTNPIKSLEFGNSALKLSEKLTWDKGYALSYSVISDAYENLGDNSNALTFRIKELKIWQVLHNQLKICGVYGNIGVSYSNLGNNLKALEYYILSLKLAEKINHKKIMVNSQVNIASIYYEQHNFIMALNYYNNALKLAEQYGYENSIGEINCNIGQIYSEQGNFEKALQCDHLALDIFKQLDRKMNMAMVLANIGMTNSLQGDLANHSGKKKLELLKYSDAIQYLKKALNISRELNNEYLTCSLLGNMGNVMRKMGKLDESEEYLNLSIANAVNIDAIDLIQESHYNFYELFKKKSLPIQSLQHFERYISIKDSISAIDNQKVLNELQIKYETEKKEAENKALEQQNKILELSLINQRYFTFGLILFSILGLGIGSLLYRQSKLKSAQKQSLIEQKLLRTQMNPHFIFNSLSSIESFIYEHQPKEAGEYLAQFAKLMRLILENSSSDYISLDKEIETLKYYLTLQKLRLNDNMEFEIFVDEQIDPEDTLIPPMLTQPFIENVIEHGFRGLKECGRINIYFTKKNDILEVKITDNGIGIAQAKQQKVLFQKHKSMAIQITYERLALLNKSKRKILIFDIKDASNEGNRKGTEVLFSIPI